MIFNHPTTFILSNLRPQFTSQTSTSHSSPPLQPVGGSEGAIWSPSRKSLQTSPQDHFRGRSSFSGCLLSSHSHATVSPVIDRNQDPLPPAPAPAQPDRNSFNRNSNSNHHLHRSSWQGDRHASFPPGLENVDGDGESSHIGQRSNRRQNRTSYQLVMEQLAMLDVVVMDSEAEGVASGGDSGRLGPAVFLYGTSAVGGAGAGVEVDGQGAVRAEEEEDEEERPELGLQLEEPPVPMPSLSSSRRRTWNQ